MARSSPTFDVFLAFNHRDLDVAKKVTDILNSYGLHVFNDAYLTPETVTEDAIWEALAESQAFVTISPGDAPTSWMALELGAAKAWNKPLYAVLPTAAAGPPQPALKGTTIVPLSRTDEIALAILNNKKAFTSKEQDALIDAYKKVGVTVDQLALQSQQLAKVVGEVNKHVKRHLSGEQVMWHLLRLRKKGDLPALARRPKKSAS